MKKIIFIIVITIICMYGILLVGLKSDSGKNLVSSNLVRIFSKTQIVPSPTIAPPNAPKTFKFDSQTDLKAELEKVNPQILDSDFQ